MYENILYLNINIMADKAPSVALVISNQYENIPQIKLNGCYADADNFINSIKKINPNTKFIIMRDNLPKSSPLFPSKANIITQLNIFCTSPEIVSFLYYSGHGSSVNDINKDEMSDISGIATATIERKANTSTNGQFKDSCIVTNEGSNYGLLLDDEINICFKNLLSNKRVYAFFDSCNSGTIIDLYSIYFSDPKNKNKFSSTTINELLNEMKKSENKTTILNAYYPKKINDIKGTIILISGTRDNAYSFEGNNLGKISGNLTSRLCWLLNNGVGNLNINDFYLLLVGLLNDPNQIPVLSCSKFISLTQTIMRDLDVGTFVNDSKIPFPMGTITKTTKEVTAIDYESGTDYDTSDDEVSVIDQVNDTISTPVTETDNEIKNQLAIAEEQARKEAELKAKQEAELKAKQEAELKAKQEAELKAKQEAELKAKQEAELKAKQAAELKAKQEAELKAKQEAELKAKQEAELKAKQEAELKAKQAAELKAKQAAELKAKQAAELKAKQEAELKAKQEAELKAKQEAELKAKQEAELKAKQAAELKAKQEAISSNAVPEVNSELIILKARHQALANIGLIKKEKTIEINQDNHVQKTQETKTVPAAVIQSLAKVKAQLATNNNNPAVNSVSSEVLPSIAQVVSVPLTSSIISNTNYKNYLMRKKQ